MVDNKQSEWSQSTNFNRKQAARRLEISFAFTIEFREVRGYVPHKVESRQKWIILKSGYQQTVSFLKYGVFKNFKNSKMF